jgi:hypothetical protein
MTAQNDSSSKRPVITAYALENYPEMKIEAAPPSRSWMNESYDRFAYRCLPMLLANQAGWFILNSHDFRARWDGTDGLSGVSILYLDGEPPFPATSMFGLGIVTFTIPYLFRTPPGWNLLARGPANAPKDGVYALEGLVETDWAVASFTMNWKITRPDQVITFGAGEPICMIVPQARRALESFDPCIAAISSNPQLAKAHRLWAARRFRFKSSLRTVGHRVVGKTWQKHYFDGTSPSGDGASDHQTKISLREFAGKHG